MKPYWESSRGNLCWKGRHVVEGKYVSLWGGWSTRADNECYGVSLWKYIRNEWDKFFQYVKFEVRNGSRTSFWSDVWSGEVSLKDSYSIAQEKDALVAGHLQFQNAFIHWELNFICLIQDWELESISSFLDLLYSVSFTSMGRTTWLAAFGSERVWGLFLL